ncbi:response regulator [Parvibium lacunae]|uniref:Response regulator n=1 Tax=Parvibium lacunae TaxID=1888893 RepID=A0A368L0C6_9BURK|nr:response regulator [Parvibium lacunae]RCS57013.1 response regulator [Parvibium lacunae]
MHVLLVEDTPDLARWISQALRTLRFTVSVVSDGPDALDVLVAGHPIDIVILDLSLPTLDGLTVLQRLRARGDHTPVLILTARASTAERVAGLNAGADDYLAKPFDLAELEARCHALLRRRATSAVQPEICLGQLRFDRQEKAFYIGTASLNLTPRELAVLETLILKAGRAVAKEHVFQQVFMHEQDANPEAIEVYVHRLRKKLQGAGVEIVTLRGLGYLLQNRHD